MKGKFNRYFPDNVKRHYVARLKAARYGRPELQLRRQEVANLLNVSSQTIAYWVEQYGPMADASWLDEGQQHEVEALYSAINAKLDEL